MIHNNLSYRFPIWNFRHSLVRYWYTYLWLSIISRFPLIYPKNGLGTSPFMYIDSLLPTVSPINHLQGVAYYPTTHPTKSISFETISFNAILVMWLLHSIYIPFWHLRYFHPKEISSRGCLRLRKLGPPCSSTWRPKSCSTLGPRKKCLRGAVGISIVMGVTAYPRKWMVFVREIPI